MVQIWNLVGIARTRRTSVFRHPWNRSTLLGACNEVIIVLFMVFVPWINDIFQTTSLPFTFFAYPFLFGLALMGVMECLKAIRAKVPLIERALGW